MSIPSSPGPVQDAVAAILDAAELRPTDIVALADAADPLPAAPALAIAVRATLEAAALVAIADGSVRAAVRFTRDRPRPRPLPGVETATADPFSQTLLGAGSVEVQGARALVGVAARELDAGGDPAFLRSRALSAFEVAARVALAQGERVWEVVGTSGSPRAHGFDEAWTVARTVSLRHPRADRRRAAATAYLGWVAGRVEAAA